MKKNEKKFQVNIGIIIMIVITIISFIWEANIFGENSVFNKSISDGSFIDAVYTKIPALIKSIQVITIAWLVNKIVQISSRQVVTISTSATTSRSFVSRNLDIDSSENYLAKAVEGITPTVKTMNTSAYTASTCGKDPSSSGYGITASGERATSWYTVAAGKGYAIGTIIYIPYFEDAPNGGWFVVQDRGGAISNSHLDVYMDSYNDCMDFGRRYLECYIYEF